MGKLFGTDGVRGVANQDLTAQLCMQLGSAYASLLVDDGCPRPRLILGRDTRVSGDMLEAAFVAGACSRGADVHLTGMLPTPAVAYLTRQENAQGGIVISASHNPIADNGIKIFSAQGFKISDELGMRIEARLESGDAGRPGPLGVDLGRVHVLAGAEDAYIRFLKEAAGQGCLEGMRLTLDCAYGAAYHVAPRVFRELGATVFSLHDTPDGSRINVACGSTDLRVLAETARQNGSQLGLAFDGDADRCLATDEAGNKVDGDQMLLAFARQGQVVPPLMVTTVMSNLGLEISLRELGIEMRRAQVGDRFVLEEMLRCGATIGGEQSGHIIFLDTGTTGDGVLTAIRFAASVKRSGRAPSELTRMPQVPQLLVNVSTPHKDRLDEDSEIVAAIAEVEDTLRGRGRLLVRPSGTEPLVRVMAEGPDEAELQRVVSHLVRIIEKRLA